MAKTNKEKIYENLQTIEEWAFLGISQKEMAELLGMGYTTFRDLKKEIPALSAVLKKPADEKKKEKEKKIAEVEKTLYQRCIGYNADVTKHYKLKNPMLDENGNVITVAGKIVMIEELKEVKEEQHIPADIGAIKFLLMNLAKEQWKSDPERLALEKKRVANDTKRTKIAEENANGQNTTGKTIEDFLDEMEEAAESTAANQLSEEESGGDNAENV